eukprot:g33279.t1
MLEDKEEEKEEDKEEDKEEEKEEGKEDLMPLFERAGKVRAMCLFRLKDGRSRGQGLCQFNASGTASKAVDMLSGCFLANPLNESSKDSRELFVKLHRGSTEILESSKAVFSKEMKNDRSMTKNIELNWFSTTHVISCIHEKKLNVKECCEAFSG